MKRRFERELSTAKAVLGVVCPFTLPLHCLASTLSDHRVFLYQRINLSNSFSLITFPRFTDIQTGSRQSNWLIVHSHNLFLDNFL